MSCDVCGGVFGRCMSRCFICRRCSRYREIIRDAKEFRFMYDTPTMKKNFGLKKWNWEDFPNIWAAEEITRLREEILLLRGQKVVKT